MKKGILGGSFNPIHRGHLALALAAKDQFDLDEVLFIPNFISPHKLQEKDVLDGTKRLAMVEIAIQGVVGFKASTVELDREGPSYMVDTVKQLRREQPEVDWSLLMGADSYRGFSTWKSAEGLVKQVHLLVAMRPQETLEELEGFPYEQIRMNCMNVSASEIREKVKKGESIEPEVPPEVNSYITEHRLYC